MSAAQFYVYALFRPTGTPFYVGKGSGRRWLRHEWRSHSPHVAAIINLAGGEVPKVIVRSGLTEAEAFATEIAFIAAIGREPNGPLVNLTDGGDGVSGYRCSPERRSQMSAMRRGENHPCFGRKLTDEQKQALRVAHTGMKASEETKAKMRASQANRPPPSVETRAKLSAAQTGEKHAMFGRKHTDDARARISAGGRGKKRSEETRSRMSAAMVRRWAAKKAVAA